MKTTKQIIKERILNEDSSLTEQQAQLFVDDLFPGIEMDIVVETTDEDMDDEI